MRDAASHPEVENPAALDAGGNARRPSQAHHHLVTMAEGLSAVTVVPAAALDAARRALADLVAAAVVGHGTPAAQAARSAARRGFGPGPAACWFTSARLTPPGAAFTNAVAASALDLDDGHRAAIGHPGAAVIPAVLAEADARDHPPERLLGAIAVGYEVAVRIARARHPARLDTVASGRWCGQGAAAALAWLRGLPAGTMAHAVGITSTTIPALFPAGPLVNSGHVKEGIAWSTVTGAFAADLAAAGFTGGLNTLDNEAAYDPAALLDGLGGPSWLVEGVYFKPYSCCRWAHAPLDALDALLAGAGATAGDLEEIEVGTFVRALTLANEAQPTSLEGAQYSIPFALALLALRGRAALLPLRDASLSDPEIPRLAERVTLVVDPELDAMFPARAPGRVTLRLRDGRRLEKRVLSPLGEPDNPLDWPALIGKFRLATQGSADGGFLDALASALLSLQAGDMEPLRIALRSTAMDDAAAG